MARSTTSYTLIIFELLSGLFKAEISWSVRPMFLMTFSGNSRQKNSKDAIESRARL
jgi:hypothetical protein